MNEKEFLEIDETSLPDIELTVEQKEKTKKRLNSYITRLKESNPELNINSNRTEISNIKNELGENADKVRHGVQGANILKELVLKSVDEEMYSTHNDILYSCFLLGCYQEAIVGYIPVFSNTTYYYKLYVTKDSLIIYSFDWFFKVLKKKTFNLNQIDRVGVAPQYLVSKELDREAILIKLVDNTETYGNYYLLINEGSSPNNDIKDLCTALTSQGVKEFSKSYFIWAHKRDKILFILYNLAFILFGLVVLSGIF